MGQVASRWQKINDNISQISGNVAVTVVAVSKKQGMDKMREAYLAGVRHFGESYLSEALEKIHGLAEWKDIVWHYIGPIQSNKTAGIARHFQWVHSCDRIKIAKRLNAQRPAEQPPLNLLLQVNISGESSKAGADPAHLDDLIDQVLNLPRLKLRGLMAIPEPKAPEARFQAMVELFHRYRHASPSWDTLSLGMSQDYPIAVRAGANMVRIGTGLFGPRTDHTPSVDGETL